MVVGREYSVVVGREYSVVVGRDFSVVVGRDFSVVVGSCSLSHPIFFRNAAYLQTCRPVVGLA